MSIYSLSDTNDHNKRKWLYEMNKSRLAEHDIYAYKKSHEHEYAFTYDLVYQYKYINKVYI